MFNIPVHARMTNIPQLCAEHRSTPGDRALQRASERAVEVARRFAEATSRSTSVMDELMRRQLAKADTVAKLCQP
jgi:hypothetical protein